MLHCCLGFLQMYNETFFSNTLYLLCNYLVVSDIFRNFVGF